MLKYTEELYARFGRKYCPTGKTGVDFDKMETDIKLLKEALLLYQLCASTEPSMEGGSTVTGWAPTKLEKAYKKASCVLCAIK